MMKFIVGALALGAMTGIAYVQPAKASCFWNGFNTVCTNGYGFGYYHPYTRPYYNYGWQR